MKINTYPSFTKHQWSIFLSLMFLFSMSYPANQPKTQLSHSQSPQLTAETINSMNRVRQDRPVLHRNVHFRSRKEFESRYRAEHGLDHQLKSTPHQDFTRIPDLPFFTKKSASPDRSLKSGQSPSSSRKVLNQIMDAPTITVNGVHADTITLGDDLQIRIEFPAGDNQAEMQPWLDMNGNGTLEPDVDMSIDDPQHIVDNDMDDEDPADGVYQITFYGDETDGPQRFSGIMFMMEAFIPFGGNDVASVYIAPIESDYSISGNVTPNMANVLVLAVPWDSTGNDTMNNDPLFWGAATDTMGNYQIFLPDTGTYKLIAQDFIGVTDGLVADTAYDVDVYGHETGYDFNFIEPTSVIAGMLTDNFMAPIPGVEIWIDNDGGPGFTDTTDTQGYFHIRVPEGDWRIQPNEMDLQPDYLIPNEQWQYLGNYDSVYVNFTAYETDAQISGHVSLNGNPWVNINIGAFNEYGWAEMRTDSMGDYTVQVSSALDSMGGYWMGIWDNVPPDFLIVQSPDNVYSGEMHADFVVQQFNGGIEGTVFDSQTNTPIPWAWIHAYNDSIDMGWGSDEFGNYHFPLPNGVYTIEAGADGYEYARVDSGLSIQDQYVNLDIYLNPISLDANISGFVYDDSTNAPLSGVEIDVGSNMFWNMTYTDSSGYYSMDVPYGWYAMQVWAEGYIPGSAFDINLDQMNPDTTIDFYLTFFQPEAVFSGVVRDGNTSAPIWGANVMVENPSYRFDTYTDENGEFYLELPADSFHVVIDAGGYEMHDDFINLNAGDTLWVEYQLNPFMVQPPMIESILDVANDQGRQVRITWNPGNPSEFGTWQQFSVWRINGADTLWDFITTVPFHGMDTYSFVAPTLVDSNATTAQTGEYWSTFVVTAHTMDPNQFFDSQPASGYSVDNLVPSVPEDFLASYSQETGTVQLTWSPIPDEDFDYFAIYRSDAAGVSPENDPYAFTTDTTFVDQDVVTGETYYYVVTAFDFNGNQSDASAEASATVLSVDPLAEIPDSYGLSQNYPNPFNPTTAIHFDLPEASKVKITIFNVLGKSVATLVDENRPAGSYTLNWDAHSYPSGMYLVRMEAGSYHSVRKMMLLK